VLSFHGDDAHIVKGLIAILFALYSEQPARAILGGTPSRCSKLGLRHLTPRRSTDSLHGRAHPRTDARAAEAV
jgi:cysteine desulfuration protein SufE